MSPVRLLYRTKFWNTMYPIRERLGRRGTALALLGFLWIFTGIITPIAPPLVGNTLLSWFPYVRAFLWVSTGIIAVFYAFRKSGYDWRGWLSLYIMAAYRVVAYSVGTLEWALAADPVTSLRSAFGALAWVAITGLIMLCSGWREPGLATGTIPVIRVSAHDYFEDGEDTERGTS